MSGGTRRQAAIAGQARRIGWPVETADGVSEWLYRITRPDGRRVQLHATPSDVNWEQAVIRQLNGRGKLWDEALADAAATREKQRREKLAADKQAAAVAHAKAEAKAQEVAASLQRAAGPHAVVVFDPAWLLAPHDLMETRRGILTPELAEKLLATVDRSQENRHQRRYRQARETEFVEIIRAKEFVVTHQGMAIDSLGRLQDGQHRAGAIAAVGEPQEMMITVGCPPENFTRLDTPLMRTARDALGMRGEKNATVLTAAVRLIIAFDRYESELYARKGQTKVSIPAIDRFALDNGDRLRAAVELCLSIRKEIKIVASALTAAIYLIGRAAGDDDPRVRQFWEDIATGTGIDRRDPVYLLRRNIFNREGYGRPDQFVILALLIKTWNFRITGRKPQALVWRSNEWFPSSIIVPPPDDNEECAHAE